MSVKIFFCYAHEDEELLNKLKAHLKPLQRQGLIDIWHDREINAGAEWAREIDKHLNTAQIILLLVSPHFMASDYCYSIEMKKALERHERGEAVVIPIILRPIYFQETPFGKLQALPIDAKPVISSSWHDQDEAFFNIIKGIRKVIKEIKLRPSPSSTILLIRHGMRSVKMEGQNILKDNEELADRGHRQAEEIAEFILNNMSPSLIITSSSPLTKQTALPTQRFFPNVPVEEWPVHEFTFFPLDEHNGEGRRALVRLYWEVCDPSLVQGPGAESFIEFINRAQEVIKRLRTLNDDLIVIFSHELFILAIFWLLVHNLSLSVIDRKTMLTFADLSIIYNIPNGAIMKMQFLGEKANFQGISVIHARQLEALVFGISN